MVHKKALRNVPENICCRNSGKVCLQKSYFLNEVFQSTLSKSCIDAEFSHAGIKLILLLSRVWVSKPTKLKFRHPLRNFKASLRHKTCHFCHSGEDSFPKFSCLLPTMVVICHATNLTSQGFAIFH